MRNIVFALFIALNALSLYGQSSKDSLLHLLELSSNDTAKVNLLNEIADLYTSTNIDSARLCVTKADSISKAINYNYGKAESLRMLSVYHLRKSNFDEAFKAFNNSLKKFKELNNSDGIANCLLGIGEVHNQISAYDSALYYFQKSLDLQLAQPIVNKEFLATTYFNLGEVHRTIGNNPLAIDFYQKALHLKLQINDLAGASRTYNNIGIVYWSLHNYPKAIENYKLSLNLRKLIGYKSGVALNYNNIAIAFFESNQHDSAFIYAQMSHAINIELNEISGLTYSYNVLGDVYLHQNNIPLAISCYQKSLEFANQTSNTLVVITVNIGLSQLYFKESNFNKALIHANVAYNLADSTKNIQFIIESSKQLVLIYAKLEQYKEAYHYQNIFKNYSDSVFNQINSKKIAGLEYEFKFKNHLIEQQKKEVEQQAVLSKQKLISFVFIVGFCIVLAIGFLVFFVFKRTQKAYKIIASQKCEIEESNALLQSQKEEIQTQNELLVQQTSMLGELDEMKNQFFTNISHELKTPLTLIVSPLEQALESDKIDKPIVNIIYRNALKLKTLIEELLQIARLEKGAVELNFQMLDINSVVKSMVGSFTNLANSKQIVIKLIGFEQACVFAFDLAQIEKVASNLLSNAIKFSPNNSTIKVEASINSSNYTLKVSDQGIGIPQNETSKVFNRFFRASNSQKVTGTGIGLSIVGDVVSLHGGTVIVGESEWGGAMFTVSLPINSASNDDDGITQNSILYNAKCNGVDQISTDKKTVLIVEDNTDLRNFLVNSLISTYNVLEADNGKNALDLTFSNKVDLIISDVMMPQMNGYELTKAIKNSSELCHIPVVILSAKSSHESVMMGLEYKADAYVTKPFSFNYLKVVVANLIANRVALHRKFQSDTFVVPSVVASISIDDQFIANAAKIVEQNIANAQFSVDDFCNALLMSRTSVHRKITEITGGSTSNFIRVMRLKRAAQLLKSNSASISEIAFQVGFSDVSYFTKCFKQQFGKTPSDYMVN